MKLLPKRKYRRKGEFITESIVFADEDLKNPVSDPTAEIVRSKDENYRQRPILRAPFPSELRRAAINGSDDNVSYTMILTRLLWDFNIIDYHLHSKDLTLQYNTENLMMEVMDRVIDIKRAFDDEEKAWYFRELMLLAKTNQYDRDNPLLNRLFGDSSIVSSLVDEKSFLQDNDKFNDENHKELLRHIYQEDVEYKPIKTYSEQKFRQRKEYYKQIAAAKGQPTRKFSSLLKSPDHWEWNPDIIEKKDGVVTVSFDKVVQKFLERLIGKNFYEIKGRNLEQAKVYANATATSIYEYISRVKVEDLIKQRAQRDQVENAIENQDIEIRSNQLPKKEYISKPALAMALHYLKIGNENAFENEVLSKYNKSGGATQLALNYLQGSLGEDIKEKSDGLKPSDRENAFFTRVFTSEEYKFDENLSKIVRLIVPKNTLTDSDSKTENDSDTEVEPEFQEPKQIQDIIDKARISYMSFLDYWRLVNDTAYYYRIDYNVVFDYLQQKLLPTMLNRITRKAETQISNAEEANQGNQTPATNEEEVDEGDNEPDESNNNNLPLNNVGEIKFNKQDFEQQPEQFTKSKITELKNMVKQQKRALLQNGTADLNEMSESAFIAHIRKTFSFVPLDYIKTLDTAGIQNIWDEAEEKWGDPHYYTSDKKTRIIDKDKNYRANKNFNAFVNKIVSNPIGAALAKYSTYYSSVFENIKKEIEDRLRNGDEESDFNEDKDFYKLCYNVYRWGRRLATWIKERVRKGFDVGTIVQAIRAANALDERLRYGKYLGIWKWFNFQDAFDYFYKTKAINFTRIGENNKKLIESSKNFTVGDLKACFDAYAQYHSHKALVSHKGLYYSQDIAVERLREIRDIIRKEYGTDEFTIQNFIRYMREHDPDALKNFYKYGIADPNVDLDNLPEFESSKGVIKKIPWDKQDFVTWDSFENWTQFNNYLFNKDMISFIYYEVVQPRERSRVYKTVRGGQLWFYYRRATLQKIALENEVALWAHDMKEAVKNKIEDYNEQIKSYDQYADTDEIGETKTYKNGFSEKVNLVAQLLVSQIHELGLSKVGWTMMFTALRQCGQPKEKKEGGKKSKKKGENDQKEGTQPKAKSLEELRKEVQKELKKVEDARKAREVDTESEAAYQEEEKEQKYRSGKGRKQDLKDYLNNIIGVKISSKEAEYIIVVARAILSKERLERERKPYEKLLEGSGEEQQLRLEEFRKKYDAKLRIRIASLKKQQEHWTNEMGEHLKACRRRIEKNKYFLSLLLNSRGVDMSRSEKIAAAQQIQQIDNIIEVLEKENKIIQSLLFVFYPKTQFDPDDYENVSFDAEDDIKNSLYNKIKTDNKGERNNEIRQKLKEYQNFVEQFKEIRKDVEEVYKTAPIQNQISDKTSYDEFTESLIETYNAWYAEKENKNSEHLFTFAGQLIRLIQTISSNNAFIDEMEKYKKNLKKGKKVTVDGLIYACKDSIATFKKEMDEMEIENLDEVAANSIISGQNAQAMYDHMLKTMGERITGITGGYDGGTSFIIDVSRIGLVEKPETPNDEFVRRLNENKRLCQYIRRWCALRSNEIIKASIECLKVPEKYTKNEDFKIEAFITNVIDALNSLKEEKRKAAYRKIDNHVNKYSKIKVSVYSLNTEDGQETYDAVFNTEKAKDEVKIGYSKPNNNGDVNTDLQGAETTKLVTEEEIKKQGVLVTILYPKEYTVLHDYLNNDNQGIIEIINNLGRSIEGKTTMTCSINTETFNPSHILKRSFGGSDTKYSDKDLGKSLKKFTDIIAQGRTYHLLDGQNERDGQFYWLTHNFYKKVNAERYKYWMLWFLVKKLPEGTKDALDDFCERVTESINKQYLDPIMQEESFQDTSELITKYGTEAQREGLKNVIEGKNLEGWQGLVVRHVDLLTNEKERNTFLEQTSKRKLLILPEKKKDKVFTSTFEQAEVVQIKYPLSWFPFHDNLNKNDLYTHIRSLLSRYSNNKLTLFEFSNEDEEEGKTKRAKNATFESQIPEFFGGVYGHIKVFTAETTFKEYVQQITHDRVKLSDLQDAASEKHYNIYDLADWDGVKELEHYQNKPPKTNQ